VPGKRVKKTPEERFGVRHRIWKAMPLLLAKRRALLEENLLFINHIVFFVEISRMLKDV